MNCTKRTDCRACHAAGLIQILDLGDQPPANAYVSDVDVLEDRYPLTLQLCSVCGMVQLGHVVDPGILFGGYSFRTGSSQRMVDHFSKLLGELVYSLPRDSLVVEIGANDGIALASVAGRVRVLGIDPAGIVAPVPMIASMFTEQIAGEIVETHGRANVIVACNVLGHVDDLDDFLRGIATLLRADGVFVFEVPYLGEFLDRGEWDTIYHEHLSYFSVSPLLTLLERHGLRLEQVERHEVHGGSIRCRVTKGTGQGEHVNRWREAHEYWRRLSDAVTYDGLVDAVHEDCTRLCGTLAGLRERGQSVIGYGAPAKATVRLNVCDIGPDMLPLIVDCTPEKQGRHVPGTHQQIVSPESVDLREFDAVLILPANHAAEITAKIHAAGFVGQIILP